MEKVIIVFKTDPNNSYASRDLIGIATSKEMAIVLCKQQAAKEHSRITKEQLFNLNNINQTQGYGGPGEFDLETNTVDVLL